MLKGKVSPGCLVYESYVCSKCMRFWEGRDTVIRFWAVVDYIIVVY